MTHHHELPRLDDTQLPREGQWIAFQEGRRLYVVRAGKDGMWTLLDHGGRTLGTFRRSRNRYRASGDLRSARANEDWRVVVRSLVPDTTAPASRTTE